MSSVRGSVPCKNAYRCSSTSLNSAWRHCSLSGCHPELSDARPTGLLSSGCPAAFPHCVLACAPSSRSFCLLVSSCPPAPSVLDTSVITVGILSNLGPKATCPGLGDHTERLCKCVLVGWGTVVRISGDSRTLINSQVCSGV